MENPIFFKIWKFCNMEYLIKSKIFSAVKKDFLWWFFFANTNKTTFKRKKTFLFWWIESKTSISALQHLHFPITQLSLNETISQTILLYMGSYTNCATRGTCGTYDNLLCYLCSTRCSFILFMFHELRNLGMFPNWILI